MTMLPEASGQLVSERQITPTLHTSLLTALRNGLSILQARGASCPGTAALRVRDWWIEVEEGQPCLEIYLDKGYVEKPTHPNGIEAETRLVLDECAEFHAFLVEETDLLDVFADSIEVRVGSPGGEPNLREEMDFRALVGAAIDLRTWTKTQNRDRFVMLLHEVLSSPQGAVVVLKEGPHTFPIPLSDVRVAKALLHHPLTLLGKKGKVPKRK